MNVLLVEPYLTGSHASWAEGYRRYSHHEVTLLGLGGAHWKWRMHGGAVTLAERFLAGDLRPDVIVASDMLDLGTFLGLTRSRTHNTPTALYFHENQVTYPWSPKDRDRARERDHHYGFVNFASAVAADRVLFNSRYHMEALLGELPGWLGRFPDHRETRQVERIRAKSEVLPLGFDFARFDAARPAATDDRPPLVLWNHRWEYDKNPGDFFDVLRRVASRGTDFCVAVAGETFDVVPEAFTRAKRELGARIVHYGFAETFEDYAGWLWRADVLPVTSHHDFFGASVMEAVYCGAMPLLPKRMAYPELLPDEHHEQCLYASLDELTDKLDAALRNIGDTRAFDIGHVAAAYDWKRIAPVYDATLEALAEEK